MHDLFFIDHEEGESILQDILNTPNWYKSDSTNYKFGRAIITTTKAARAI